MTIIEMLKTGKLEMNKTRKIEYCVDVAIPAIGTVVQNELEGTTYTTSAQKPVVIKGTVGELWTVDTAKLTKTYQTLDGEEIDPSKLNERFMKVQTKIDKDAPEYFAFRLDFLKYGSRAVNVPVVTSWGETLLANRLEVAHGRGDYIVCASNCDKPDMNDMWVVNGKVFETTYDMRCFQ